jgi:hypothetical protein
MVFSYVFFRPQLAFLIIVLTLIATGLSTSPMWKGMSALFHWLVILGSTSVALSLVVYKGVFVKNK